MNLLPHIISGSIVLGLFMAAGPSEAAVWACPQKDGTTLYTDHPQPGCRKSSSAPLPGPSTPPQPERAPTAMPPAPAPSIPATPSSARAPAATGQAAKSPTADGRPATPVHEEPTLYLAGYGGGTFPQPLTMIRGTGTAAGSTVSDLALQPSGIFGLKAGMFPSRDSWVGLEAEVFFASPHIKQQLATISGGGLSLTGLLRGIHLTTTTTAVNILVRYPDTWLQPYIGLGPALINARVSSNAVGGSDQTAWGMNALAGLRCMLTDHVAIFGEFKYTYAGLSFDNALPGGAGFTATYSVPALVAGASLHF